MTFRFGRKVAAAFAVAAFLTGCASSESLDNIRVGMTKQEVIQVLGNPTSVNAQSGTEFLIYNEPLAKLNVIYGKVVEIYMVGLLVFKS